MSARATVLYDTPGPRAVRFNKILTVITTIALLAILAWVLWKLNDGGQLDADKWNIFLEGSTWTTYILPGLLATIGAALLSIVFSLIFGAVFGIGRLSTNRAVRWFCGIVVELFRSIPVLVLILFGYAVFGFYGVFPSQYLGLAAVVFALTLYNGSVIAEVLRSGIESLPKGQSEAAYALGMSWGQTMRKVLLPQAVAAMLPAIVSQMVIALKDSALGYAIGFVEVVRSGRQLGEFYGAMLPALLAVAAIMILINFGLSKLAERIEQQLRAGRARRNIVAKVPHQPDQGLETKDSVNVDWHAEGHKDLRPGTD
ncbi:MAG: amino acid ABC transporter permease [Corynebacterium sp.]|uniref:amino acid ABC transporter permease n=1 Tax=Corynebacterium TaxID=1716 RepID=UPI002647A6F1|nr:amino acid ABC transporter permease [Corynebacterium sp.]MDN5721928.1 amino acid ABC transporter permease [Corynebacterium sp.]MDN6283283.1 amino acid ABC transporter permease [Corynebacterium sp.]MDN6306652.1 amino acid ABC transporter permease [Corynebacterium sp.]MDN6368667.1 amino acid ABC transporter permease [Corynebacterium sp.]MDN6376515.1 amino acid ABC transporter permease [Corynebacterium sp.]